MAAEDHPGAGAGRGLRLLPGRAAQDRRGQERGRLVRGPAADGRRRYQLAHRPAPLPGALADTGPGRHGGDRHRRRAALPRPARPRRHRIRSPGAQADRQRPGRGRPAVLHHRVQRGHADRPPVPAGHRGRRPRGLDAALPPLPRRLHPRPADHGRASRHRPAADRPARLAGLPAPWRRPGPARAAVRGRRAAAGGRRRADGPGRVAAERQRPRPRPAARHRPRRRPLLEGRPVLRQPRRPVPRGGRPLRRRLGAQPGQPGRVPDRRRDRRRGPAWRYSGRRRECDQARDRRRRRPPSGSFSPGRNAPRDGSSRHRDRGSARPGSRRPSSRAGSTCRKTAGSRAPRPRRAAS